MKAHMYPVSKLAPQTDASGTKVAAQSVARLRGDVTAFQRNTIAPLSARIQQRVHSDDDDATKKARQEQVQAIAGDDLRKLIKKYHGGLEKHQPKHLETNLDKEMVSELRIDLHCFTLNELEQGIVTA